MEVVTRDLKLSYIKDLHMWTYSSKLKFKSLNNRIDSRFIHGTNLIRAVLWLLLLYWFFARYLHILLNINGTSILNHSRKLRKFDLLHVFQKTNCQRKKVNQIFHCSIFQKN